VSIPAKKRGWGLEQIHFRFWIGDFKVDLESALDPASASNFVDVQFAVAGLGE
jgi:hypothetical protein